MESTLSNHGRQDLNITYRGTLSSVSYAQTAQIQLSDYFTNSRLIRFTLPSILMADEADTKSAKNFFENPRQFLPTDRYTYGSAKNTAFHV